jgi:chromosome segregation ATPase
MTERRSPEEQRSFVTEREAIDWLQAQLLSERAHNTRLSQQMEQLQAMVLDLAEQLRTAEAQQREVAAQAANAALVQDGIIAIQDVLNRVQEAQAMINARIDRLERERAAEMERERLHVNDLYHRVQALERDVQSWKDRQTSLEDFSRRFQEAISKTELAVRSLETRADSAETRAARAVESVNRAEQGLAEVERVLADLKREDETLNERVRLAHEVAHRAEGQIEAAKEGYRDLPVLRERIELLRAERQRVEDRAARLEAAVYELETWRQKQEHVATTLDARSQALDTRLSEMQEKLDESRTLLISQLLKLHQSQERLKRRQIEDLEREIKELRKHAASLKDE